MEKKEPSSSSAYSKRPLWQWVAIYAVVAAVVYGGIYYFFLSKNGQYSQSTTNQGQNSYGSIPQKFQDSSFASSSYQIYPGPLTDQTKQAIAGFKIDTKTQTDGSAQISLTSTNPEYKNQQVMVKPGYVLYFIEKNGGDDSQTGNTDQTTRDDSTVLVDPQGYIVQ